MDYFDSWICPGRQPGAVQSPLIWRRDLLSVNTTVFEHQDTPGQLCGLVGSEPTINCRLKCARPWMFKDLGSLLTVSGR